MKVNTTTLRRLLVSVSGLAGLIAAALVPASAQELNLQHAAVRAVIAVQKDVTPGLMNNPAVLGTAVGVDNGSDPVLVVYVDRNHASVGETIRSLPVEIRGKLVRVEATDKFKAYVGKPGGVGGGGGVSHTEKQSFPIKLGTSGGWQNDLANGYCCGGTLGSLIQVAGGANEGQYILSNYHVFEADIIPGGNTYEPKTAETGANIVQPGLIDVSCKPAQTQIVGSLVRLNSLPNSQPFINNNVDCSVARATPGAVSGQILEIGAISSSTVGASINQAVKKSGRTTGLTRSKVSGLNATIRVSYENECAGSTVFTVTFNNQIVIANTGSKFLDSGDSGSLMVEDTATNPRAVGLLYAGGGNTAIANPIGEVLTFIGSKLGGTATMVNAP